MIKEVIFLNDFDVCMICGIVASLVGIPFVSMEYKLCMANPHEWFVGTITGVVFFALCFVIYRKNKNGKDRF